MPDASTKSSSGWPTAHVALGSNLGDRRQFINAALSALDGRRDLRVVAHSPLLETEPVGPPGQGRYLNAAAVVRTALSPRQLLDAMLEIELALGRDRRIEPRHGPRVIDLDLLLYEDQVIAEPGLTVPHPRMHERRFVLEPLAAVAAAAVHPILGRDIATLLRALVTRECPAGLEGRSMGPAILDLAQWSPS